MTNSSGNVVIETPAGAAIIHADDKQVPLYTCTCIIVL